MSHLSCLRRVVIGAEVILLQRESYLYSAFANHVLMPTSASFRVRASQSLSSRRCSILLIFLVENCDRIVTKDDLIGENLGRAHRLESTLTSRINAARKAVGRSCRDQGMIHHRAKGVSLRRRGARDHHGRPRRNGSAVGARHRVRKPNLAAPDRAAIAVLPFTNMSGEAEQEYFSEGSARTSSPRCRSCAGQRHRP